MRRTVGPVLVGGALVLATACSSSSTAGVGAPASSPSEVTSSTAVISSAAATTSGAAVSSTYAPPPVPDLTGLAPTAADFPAPYTYVPITPEQLAEISATEEDPGTADPAECARGAQLTETGDLTGSDVAFALDEQSEASIVVIVGPQTYPLDGLREVAADCPSFEVSRNGLTAGATLELAPLGTAAGADDVAGLVAGVEVPGSPVPFVVPGIFADVGDVRVQIVGTPGRDMAPVDTGVLEQILATTVAKVRERV